MTGTRRNRLGSTVTAAVLCVTLAASTIGSTHAAEFADGPGERFDDIH